MMFNAQGSPKKSSLLAILSGTGNSCDSEEKGKRVDSQDQSVYPFPELTSSGRLEVIVEFICFCTICCLRKY